MKKIAQLLISVTFGLVVLTTLIACGTQPNQPVAEIHLKTELQANATCVAGNTVLGNQVLATQAEVNALTGASKIAGSLFITSGNTLDLSPLHQLQEIEGLFMLFDSDQTVLEGFNCLTSLGSYKVGDFSALNSLNNNVNTNTKVNTKGIVKVSDCFNSELSVLGYVNNQDSSFTICATQ